MSQTTTNNIAVEEEDFDWDELNHTGVGGNCRIQLAQRAGGSIPRVGERFSVFGNESLV